MSKQEIIEALKGAWWVSDLMMDDLSFIEKEPSELRIGRLRRDLLHINDVIGKAIKGLEGENND